jgi:hypothetical protein
MKEDRHITKPSKVWGWLRVAGRWERRGGNVIDTGITQPEVSQEVGIGSTHAGTLMFLANGGKP